MIELQSVERGAKEHSNRYSSYLKINPGCHFFQKFKRRSIRRPNKLSALLSVKFLGGGKENGGVSRYRFCATRRASVAFFVAHATTRTEGNISR